MLIFQQNLCVLTARPSLPYPMVLQWYLQWHITNWSMFTPACRWQRGPAVRHHVRLLEQNGRAWQHQQNNLCTKRRPSIQSDWFSLCPLLVAMDPILLQANNENWSDLVDAQADVPMPRLIWVIDRYIILQKLTSWIALDIFAFARRV